MIVPARQGPLAIGEAAPLIQIQTNVEPEAEFGNLAGRHVLVCVLGRASAPVAAAALDALAAHLHLQDWQERVFLAVTSSADDAADARLRALEAQILVARDTDRAALRAWGLLDRDGASMRPVWMLLDPMLRLLGMWPLQDSGAALAAFAALPSVEAHAGAPLQAPVLLLPRVFEPEFCRSLIAHAVARGSTPSGVTREIGGQTVLVPVPGMKRRRDCLVEDPALLAGIRQRLAVRLLPAIRQAFQFKATRIERYVIGCYDAADAGGFSPHRDDTIPATAHRRFAVSLNLDAEAHAGGDLRFPEFGQRLYRPPTGGAVVFSCSLLHEATPVTAGRRHVFLPFLYDEAAEVLRSAPGIRFGAGFEAAAS
ncbi:MAG: hypothetical protein JWP04_779 [Belnapia sp.]|nr:hypothetical protein [Belnapia sp.]